MYRAVRERMDPQDAAAYTEELLHQDLQQLYGWGKPGSETIKVSKIEDFKKKRYWYQASLHHSPETAGGRTGEPWRIVRRIAGSHPVRDLTTS
ncbi:DUF2397 family protein [Effusibacillus pohliae]|uniref:DUF2397 family protein n=1 Tax=Effusibacillus pohliae TaxID=232270 RepID=UPI003899074B